MIGTDLPPAQLGQGTLSTQIPDYESSDLLASRATPTQGVPGTVAFGHPLRERRLWNLGLPFWAVTRRA